MTLGVSVDNEKCLGILFGALLECRNGCFDKAKRAAAFALLSATRLPPESRTEFGVAFCYTTLLLELRRDPASITPEMRSHAGALLDKCSAPESSEAFATLMFELLTESGEPRRALPFAERVLALGMERNQSIFVADWLWKIGGCYSRLGRRDHAAVAYRGSLRIFRNQSADPRLPAVLLALGNAVRKTQPAEAEALYKEAAAWWESKGQLESATPAWSNLAIVCSDQERFEEALGYYERVRQVREASTGTPPVQIGNLYNNLASCYRKMKRFPEAHQAIERALKILAQHVPRKSDHANPLASAVGTKGMILRDEGRDSESVAWFRRASAELEKQPNPNVENLIEELEYEAAALERLNRADEARAVEEKLERVRQSAREVQMLNYDEGAPLKASEGTLFIEVECGIRSGASEIDLARSGAYLNDLLEERNLGGFHGWVRGPECATLLCYGPDAEAMYGALEPKMRSDARFEGAQVTIRQGSQQRAVALPRRRVN